MTSKGVPDPEYILRADGHPITCLQFCNPANDKTCLISGNQNGTLSIWDLKKRLIISAWNAHHNQMILSIKMLCDNTLMTYGRDGFVHIWQTNSGGWNDQAIHSIPCKTPGFCPVTFTKINNSDILFIPSDNKPSDVDIVSLNSSYHSSETIGSLVSNKNSQGPSDNGMCMGISVVDNTKIIVGYEDGSLKLWDIRNSSKLLNCIQVYDDSVMALSFNSSINKGVVGSVCDKLKVFTINRDSDTIEIVKDDLMLTNPGINCLVIRNDGKLFASGGWDSQARLFSCKKFNPLAVLSFHKESIQVIDFAEDNTIGVGSRDGAISVWNLYK